MPRQARIKSSTGIYHVMIKGINKEQIYKKDIYKANILKIIREIKEKDEFFVIAYCIMNNHMHLLIKVEEDNLADIMRKINVKFAMYYNYFEERNGYVFQNRFRSEAVEDRNYLLCALRYIHNNPVKAMLADSIYKYPWSSANDYISGNSNIISEKYLHGIMKMFNNKQEFINFHGIFDDRLYMDIKEEQNKVIQEIINNTIDHYILEKGIVDKTQITQAQKEELASKLLKYKFISKTEIAEKCNISIHKVSDIKI